MILLPAPMSLSRWWYLVKNSHRTLLRNLEFEAISRMHLQGMTLDVGGGAKSSYYNAMVLEGPVHSVNISEEISPTYIADLGQSIPAATAAYDNVICFNTLEHLWKDAFALYEIFRVLKPGGAFYGIVPFLYRVHASPSDYHRHTEHYWQGFLEQIGFSGEAISIEPLVFGPFSAPLSLVEFRYGQWIRRFLRAFVLFIPILKMKIRPHSADKGTDIPLGYFIRACK